MGTGEQVKQEITAAAGAVEKTAGKVVGNEDLEEDGRARHDDAAARAAQEQARHEAKHADRTAMPDFGEDTTLTAEETTH